MSSGPPLRRLSGMLGPTALASVAALGDQAIVSALSF